MKNDNYILNVNNNNSATVDLVGYFKTNTVLAQFNRCAQLRRRVCQLDRYDESALLLARRWVANRNVAIGDPPSQTAARQRVDCLLLPLTRPIIQVVNVPNLV